MKVCTAGGVGREKAQKEIQADTRPAIHLYACILVFAPFALFRGYPNYAGIISGRAQAATITGPAE
jgi:hypothetical protein